MKICSSDYIRTSSIVSEYWLTLSSYWLTLSCYKGPGVFLKCATHLPRQGLCMRCAHCLKSFQKCTWLAGSLSYLRSLIFGVNFPDRCVCNIGPLSFLTLPNSFTLLYFSPACSSSSDIMCSICSLWVLFTVYPQHLQYCLAYIYRMNQGSRLCSWDAINCICCQAPVDKYIIKRKEQVKKW